VLFRQLDLGSSDATGEQDAKEVVAILSSAIRGGDAYAAVRRACKYEEGVLRIGNRFLRRARVKEVAFLAVGNCAAAMARGFHDALGEVVTQGLVAGPEPPPDPWPFLYRKVTDPILPSTEGAAMAAEALELGQGLGEQDLFVPLISPGALGMLAAPPAGMALSDYQELSRRVASSPSARTDLPTVTGVLSLAQGGRLARAAAKVPIEALLVARGDGGRPLGAGPTVPPTASDPVEARGILERLGLLDSLPAGVRQALAPSDALPSGAESSRVHNVIVASPADALEMAGAEAAEKKHGPRLIALNDDSPPEEAADHLLVALEEYGPRLSKTPGEGLALFAGLTLGVPEGGEDREVLARFLSHARDKLERRGALVAILSTVGSIRPEARPSGGFVSTDTAFSRSTFTAKSPRVFDLAPGFTDVGAIAMAYLTRPLPPTETKGKKGRRR
jgi:glycerate-2-kinase